MPTESTTPEQPTCLELADEPGWIRGVDVEEMDAVTAIVARRTVRAVGEALGLPRLPDILWFERCGPDHPDAVAVPTASRLGRTAISRDVQRIMVRCDLPTALTQRVVVHETRHFWQGIRGVGDSWSSAAADAAERDAVAFEAAWTAGLVAKR